MSLPILCRTRRFFSLFQYSVMIYRQYHHPDSPNCEILSSSRTFIIVFQTPCMSLRSSLFILDDRFYSFQDIQHNLVLQFTVTKNTIYRYVGIIKIIYYWSDYWIIIGSVGSHLHKKTKNSKYWVSFTNKRKTHLSNITITDHKALKSHLISVMDSLVHIHTVATDWIQAFQRPINIQSHH